MNQMRKYYEKWREKEPLFKGITVAIAILLLFTIVFCSIDFKKKANNSLFKKGAGTEGQLQEDLSDHEKQEITNLITSVLKEKQIMSESDIGDKAKDLKETLKEELKDINYLTEEEKNEIINNLDKFIKNDYQSYVSETTGRISKFEQIFNDIIQNLSQKADVEVVHSIEQKTITLIDVDEELKKTDLDLYNRLLALNGKLIELNQNLDDSSEDSNERIDKTIQNFNTILEELKKDTTKDYSDRISDLHVTIDEYISNLNNQIEELNNELAISNNEIKNSISDLDSRTNESITELDHKTDDAIKEMQESNKLSVENLSSYLIQVIDELSAKLLQLIGQNTGNIEKNSQLITTNNTLIQEINGKTIENKSGISDLTLRVDDCFQLVSSGKAFLASTLTDKGIETNLDASFGEINNNILNLYTAAFTAGVDSVEGINADVEYEYHYHSGNASEGGGCYSVKNIHYHKGDATSGGGCYTNPEYDISYYHPPCTGGWIKDKDSWGDKDGNRDRRYRGWCSVCGYYCASYSEWNSYPSEVGPTHTSLNSVEVKTLKGYSLSCGHSEGELLGYETGCGMVDGQIISAKINMINGKAKSTNILTSLSSLGSFSIETEKEENVVVEEETQNEDKEDLENKENLEDNSFSNNEVEVENSQNIIDFVAENAEVIAETELMKPIDDEDEEILIEKID